MTRDELLEQIRSLIKEPLTDTVQDPWTYSNEDLYPYIRSAIRVITAKGVTTTAAMTVAGILDPLPTLEVGMLIAYHVVSSLLRGDMIQKLNAGELGISFRAGADAYDTKTVANVMKALAVSYDADFVVHLTMILSNPESAGQGVFGDSTLSGS